MNKKGFTIVELIIGMTLLTITVFAFAPMMAMSFSMVIEAGNDNKNTISSTGDIEDALATGLASGMGGSWDVPVVLEIVGGPSNIGRYSVEYASGEYISDDDPADPNDEKNLETFVGQMGEIQNGITLDPSTISVSDLSENDITNKEITVNITASGFKFRDVTRFRVEDSTGNVVAELSDKFKLVSTPDQNKATLTIPSDAYDFLTYEKSPYRVYYGNYWAYQIITIIKLEVSDLLVGGKGGIMLSSSDTLNDGRYSWVLEGSATNTSAAVDTTINDIIWVPTPTTDDANLGKYTVVGNGGTYFEIVKDIGVRTLEQIMAGKTSTLKKYDTSDLSYDIKSPYTNFSAAILSPFDNKNTIDFVGSFAVSSNTDAGQYSLSYDDTGVTLNAGISSSEVAKAGNLSHPDDSDHKHAYNAAEAGAAWKQNDADPYNDGNNDSFYDKYGFPYAKDDDGNDKGIVGAGYFATENNSNQTPRVNDISIGTLPNYTYNPKNTAQSDNHRQVYTMIVGGGNRVYYREGKYTTTNEARIENLGSNKNDDYIQQFYSVVQYGLREKESGRLGNIFGYTWWRDRIQDFGIFEAPNTELSTTEEVSSGDSLSELGFGNEPLAISYGKYSYKNSSSKLVENQGTFVVGYEDGKLYQISDPDAKASINFSEERKYEARISSGAYNLLATIKDSSGNAVAVNSIAYGANGWVAVGNNGAIYYAHQNDLKTWTRMIEFKTGTSSSSTTNISDTINLNQVIYSGSESSGQFFVVGDDASIYHFTVSTNSDGTAKFGTMIKDNIYVDYDYESNTGTLLTDATVLADLDLHAVGLQN